MKSLTGISQGFDKCTKATLRNNYFWGTPPDDCFCLKRQKFKTILIWRNRKKMNRNKNLLMIYYLWKKLPKFSSALKKVFHAFSFQLCSTANSKFSFYVSFSKIYCTKIQTMSQVLHLSILGEILSVLFTLTSSFASDWKKVDASWTFFSVARMR